MSDRLDQFGTDVDVVLITFTEPEHLRRYDSERAFAFPVVTNPDRASYRAFGLDRGSVTRVWGLRMVRRYAEILRSDGFAGLRRPVEDTLQLGGDFVIDPEGTLVYGFWGAGPDDRPPVDDLIAAVRLA